MIFWAQVVGGFLLLLFAADYMVRGAVAISHRLTVPPIVIGMTVVAFGTSAPELVVGLEAGLSGAAGLALGNVIGSNVANVLLVLGCAALVAPIVPKQGALIHDSVVLMGGSIVFAFFCVQGEVGRIGGFLLVAGLLAFVISAYKREYGAKTPDGDLLVEEVEEVGSLPDSLAIEILALVAGLAGILFGADLLVEGAIGIAREFGVAEEVIGLTVIAIGTSLPELAASLAAAYRGHADVAVGNVVGSNLFNILGIAGIVAIVTPLPVAGQLISFDIWIMLLTSALVLPLLLWRWRLMRSTGLVFLISYAGYIAAQAFGVERLLGLFG
ncbi:MAG: calcium/sodium antiporter [Rhodospirillales bacterium]